MGEVKVKKPEEIESGKIEQELATKRSQKARKNTDSRFYKPEHIELLMQTYDKCSKYPSKEEMSELAKIIGVLPIKILWWFTHRRRIERKKGDNLLAKNAKNESSEKPDSAIETDTEFNSNNLATPVKIEPEIASEIPKITAEIPKITSEKIPKSTTTSEIANKISKETDEITSDTLTKASEILSKTSEGPNKTSEVQKKTSESPKKTSEILKKTSEPARKTLRSHAKVEAERLEAIAKEIKPLADILARKCLECDNCEKVKKNGLDKTSQRSPQVCL